MVKIRSLYLIWAWNGTGTWHSSQDTTRHKTPRRNYHS